MGAKIDYANARTISDLDIIYLTGAGFVREPFKGLSPESAWGWDESVWGGELDRSKGFTLENIDQVDFGKVARCEIVFPYMNIKEFEKLRRLLGERHLIVDYYNVDKGERETQEMAITKSERERLYNFGSSLIGVRNVSVKLVATNRDNTDIGSKFTISYNANGGTGTIASKEKFYADNYSIVSPDPNEFYKIGYRFDYWSTKADGTGWKYIPNERITVWDNLTLYAIWV